MTESNTSSIPGEPEFPLPDLARCMSHCGSLAGDRCPHPAVATVIFGCEGEYIRPNRICTLCLASLRNGVVHVCGRCLERGIEHSVQTLDVRMDDSPAPGTGEEQAPLPG